MEPSKCISGDFLCSNRKTTLLFSALARTRARISEAVLVCIMCYGVRNIGRFMF